MNTIHISYDLLEDDHLLKVLRQHSGRFVLLSDQKVASLYAEPFLAFMDAEELPCESVTFSGGEKSKNRRVKEEIEDALFEKKYGRDTLLIAMGGGVVTDIGGFVAATYCRGIPYLSIPTTLLGMVDASIGGKTGVNVKYGKNLIGAIHSPEAIFMDLSMLSTLPDQEMLSGSAEVIKYGLIADKAILSMLRENLTPWKQRDLDLLKKVVKECARIKKKVVNHDLKESGERRILNFGHTIGHAIEALEEYSFSHGEAIAIGMVVEGLIAMKMGQLDEKDFDDLYELVQLMGFPLTLSSRVTTEKMMETMQLDKKGEKGEIRFVILHGLGHVNSYKGAYCTPVDQNLLDEALGWMVAECVK